VPVPGIAGREGDDPAMTPLPAQSARSLTAASACADFGALSMSARPFYRSAGENQAAHRAPN